MDWWFTMMGDEFSGETDKSKKMRVAQLCLACPIRSVARKFINTLDKAVSSNEGQLKAALIDHFHDAEQEGQADENIVTAMSTLSQGKQDVFEYSRKVLKLLRRKPSGLQALDNILIGYYTDGLTSRRLCELAVTGSSEHETPFQVVKKVMCWATKLRLKGYRKHSSRESDDEDDEEDDTSSENEKTSGGDAEDSDSEDDLYGLSWQQKKAWKVAEVQKVDGRKSKRSKGKEGRKENAAVKLETEMREVRRMMQTMMQRQQEGSTSGAGIVAGRTKEDVIPLDTYTVGQNNGRNQYGRRDTATPTTHRPTEYPER